MDDSSIYAVHTTRPDEVGAVEVVYLNQAEARRYARSRSQDRRILSASVTKFLIGQLGARYPVCWYIDGIEQNVRAVRPGPIYPAAHEEPCPAQ